MTSTQEHGSAISALLDGYGRRLYAYLRVLLRDDDAATVAFNDTAAAAFDGAGRPAQAGQLTAWLFYLAHEQARRHRPALRPEDDQATIRATARRSRSRTQQNLADADQARLALLQLAPAEREVLVLGLYGLRPADVARIVGIRPEAATAAAARARARYVKALGPTRPASKADELLALALTFAQESLPHDRIVLGAPTAPDTAADDTAADDTAAPDTAADDMAADDMTAGDMAADGLAADGIGAGDVPAADELDELAAGDAATDQLDELNEIGDEPDEPSRVRRRRRSLAATVGLIILGIAIPCGIAGSYLLFRQLDGGQATGPGTSARQPTTPASSQAAVGTPGIVARHRHGTRDVVVPAPDGATVSPTSPIVQPTTPPGPTPTTVRPTSTGPTSTRPTTPPTSPVSWSTSGPPGPTGSPSPVSWSPSP